MSVAEKRIVQSGNNVTIAENVPKVYAAGQKSVGVRETVSGNPCVLDYVHTANKELDVLLSTAEPSRLTDETFSVCGKNLCDYTKFKPYSGGTITLVENGFTFTGRYYCSLDGSFLPLGRYYMSWKFESESSITPVWRLQYQDGTFSSQIQNGAGMTITKPVKNVLLYHEMVGGTHTATYTDIQLEMGTVATEYQPYQCTEYTIKDEDKVSDYDTLVKGVKPVYPVTILTTGNADVTITAEYYLDAQSKINDMGQAVATVGGDL